MKACISVCAESPALRQCLARHKLVLRKQLFNQWINTSFIQSSHLLLSYKWLSLYLLPSIIWLMYPPNRLISPKVINLWLKQRSSNVLVFGALCAPGAQSCAWAVRKTKRRVSLGPWPKNKTTPLTPPKKKNNPESVVFLGKDQTWNRIIQNMFYVTMNSSIAPEQALKDG